VVFPGHGAGTLCGAGLSQRKQSTLAYERATNLFLQKQSEQTFVDTLLMTVPEFPDYYRRMKELNAAGPPLLDELPGGTRIAVEDFAERMKEPDMILLDVRRPEAFGGAHIPGSFNIGAGPNLSMWAAWVLPYDRPILLIGDANTDMDAARRSLIRVGLDTAVGSLRGSIGAWLESGGDQGHVPQVSVHELRTILSTRPRSVFWMFAVQVNGRADILRAQSTFQEVNFQSMSRMCQLMNPSTSSAAAVTDRVSRSACWLIQVARGGW
jgi:hydroxyacylglutathione hydrolase